MNGLGVDLEEPILFLLVLAKVDAYRLVLEVLVDGLELFEQNTCHLTIGSSCNHRVSILCISETCDACARVYRCLRVSLPTAAKR